MNKIGTLLVAALLCPLSSWAQEGPDTETKTTVDSATTENATNQAEENSTDSSAGGKVEKIQVTGSHIKRIDIEGPSPVLTLDREYLTRTGYNNVGDVLRDTTVASFGGERETALAGGAATGASTTSLRGFGPDRILILLDGKRLPSLGGTSQVDLSLIPMVAVASIEILKDGASAIYGSDALGGVINIKTKKNFDGAAIDLGYTKPDSPGGARTDVKLSYGKTFSKGEFLGALQYRNNSETWSRDYDYARPTPTWFSQTGNPGTWVDATNGAQAGGPNDPCPAGRVNAQGFCSFDYSTFSQITPKIEQYNGLLSGKYEVNESLSVYARGIYTHRFVTNQLAPPPDQFRDDTATGGLNTEISNATAVGWGLGASGQLSGADLPLVRYRPVEELGPRQSEVTTDSYALHTGVQGFFSDSWEWEASATHSASETENVGVSGYANKKLMFDAAQADPASFNPFNAPGNKSNLDFARYQPKDVIESTMSTVNLQATGELLDMPAGPLSLAVGLSTAWQTYSESSDAVTDSGAQWGGGVSFNGNGRRDFQSAYAEFALPPFTGMELQLAGRFDNYSDFGSTVNPKLGFRYAPMNWLSFRGSWGTGFRAPSLQDLYRSQTIGYPFGNDPLVTPNFEGQFETLAGGNTNLKEEKSTSVNVGTIVQILRNLSFVADYWQVTQDNKVSNLSTSTGIRDIFAAESAFGPSYLQGLGINVIRDANNNNAVERIIAPNVNLASREVSGLDLGLKYSLPVFGGFRFRASVDHALILELLEEPFPGLGIENRVGFAGNPHWRNTVSFGLGDETWDFTTMIRTIGEQNAAELSADPAAGGKTRDHTELDIRAQYTAEWDGVFAVMIRNAFNTDRPLGDEYQTNGFLDTALYDPFGRSISVTYRQNF